jgi:hypothetical protein
MAWLGLEKGKLPSWVIAAVRWETVLFLLDDYPCGTGGVDSFFNLKSTSPEKTSAHWGKLMTHSG